MSLDAGRARFGAPSLFFVATTLLACVEEAVACAMTASAPLWGLRVGEAYITASANYPPHASHPGRHFAPL